MEDPTPLVNHVYEAYVQMARNMIYGYTETETRLQAQGKDLSSTDLFNILYTESRVPLFGQPHCNQFVCINENHEGEGEIVTPSKLYMFERVSEVDVPVTKFAEQGRSEEAPECILCIHKPDPAAIKDLLSTCCEISKRQPVTHLFIADATCEDLTSEEVPTLSRNVQVVCAINCEWPRSFWKKLLHQMFNCVHLRKLWLESTNLHQLEEDLDELLEHLKSNTGLTNHQVEVLLTENIFSEKFMEKWNGSNSGIICNIQLSESNGDEDGLTLDEINWLIEEQAKEINLSRENITADVVKGLEICEPVGRLILRDCRISDGTVFEAFLGLTANRFLTALDLSDTKLGHNAIHISSLLAHGNLKQLLLRHCGISTTALDFILPLLSSCKELTHLDLYGNNLEDCGRHVAEFIVAWGEKPPLRELNLGHCSMTSEACRELLLALGNCKSLTILNMTANYIQGGLIWFLPHPHEGLHSLDKLFLYSTSPNSEDMSHLAQLIEKRKLPMLRELHLASNALHTMKDVVENLVQACATHHLMELMLNICFNNLSKGFQEKCLSLCEGTTIELRGIGYWTNIAWTEDEFLEGFYDSEEVDDDDMEIDDEDEERDENEKDKEEDDDGIDNEEDEDKRKDEKKGQEKEVVMGKDENKAMEDDDKEETNR